MGGTGFEAGFTIAPVEMQTSTSTAPSNAIDTEPAKSFPSAAARETTDAETPDQKSTTSASDATKTGLGAGLGVGLPLLAGLTVALSFLRRLRNRSNSKRTESEKRTAGVVDDVELLPDHERQERGSLPVEMPNNRRDTTQEIGVLN